jgi:hypothetical protein
VGVFVVADADALDGLLRVQPEGRLLGVQLLGKGARRLDVAVVLQELENLPWLLVSVGSTIG